MSGPTPRGDIDPSEWVNPKITYDTVAAAYAETFLHELDHKPFDRELLTRFAAAITSTTTTATPLCDLGCGPGHIGAYLAELGLPTVGIDLSTGMVEQARLCYPSLTFAEGDMTALTLADGSLAAVVSFYALIHIPRSVVPVALSEMHRVLAPGGSVLIAVHGGQGTLHATKMLEQPCALDATLFTLPELCAMVSAAGFSITEAHERDPVEEELTTPRLYLWATSGN